MDCGQRGAYIDWVDGIVRRKSLDNARDSLDDFDLFFGLSSVRFEHNRERSPGKARSRDKRMIVTLTKLKTRSGKKGKKDLLLGPQSCHAIPQKPQYAPLDSSYTYHTKP